MINGIKAIVNNVMPHFNNKILIFYYNYTNLNQLFYKNLS